MTLPVYPNRISALDIALEYGYLPITYVDIQSLHAGSGYVPDGTVGFPQSTRTRIPSGLTSRISYDDFHGSAKLAGYTAYLLVVGGGGAGGAGRRDKSGGAGSGGGGGGVCIVQWLIPLINFQAIITVGAAGQPDYSFEAQDGFGGGASSCELRGMPGGPTTYTSNGGGGGGGNCRTGGAGGPSTTASGNGGAGSGGAGGSNGVGAGGGGGGVDDRTCGTYNKGGDGAYWPYTNAYYGGGGGGGGDGGSTSPGGNGGGGNGQGSANGDAGSDGLGGGGGGGASWGNNSWNWGGRGGSGCVIVAYPTSYGKLLSGGSEFVSGNYYIHQFTSVSGGQQLNQV
jgi:hypothetical protein